MSCYKKRIIEMLKEIHNERFIMMIYGFARRMYRESVGK